MNRRYCVVVVVVDDKPVLHVFQAHQGHQVVPLTE